MSAKIAQTCKFCPEQLHFSIISAVSEDHPDGSKTMKMECQDTDGSVAQHYIDKHADKIDAAAFKEWSIRGE